MDNIRELDSLYCDNMDTPFSYEEISASLIPIERFVLSWFFLKTKNVFLNTLVYPNSYIQKDMGITYETQIVLMLSSDPMFGFDTIKATLQPELDLLLNSLSLVSETSLQINNKQNLTDFQFAIKSLDDNSSKIHNEQDRKEFQTTLKRLRKALPQTSSDQSLKKVKLDLWSLAGILKRNSPRSYIYRYLDNFKFSLESLRTNKKCYCDAISKQNTEYKEFLTRQNIAISYSAERHTLEMDRFRVGKKQPILLPINFQLNGRGLSWDGKQSYSHKGQPTDKPFQIQLPESSPELTLEFVTYYQYVSIAEFEKEYHLPFRIDFVPPECILLGKFCDVLEPIVREVKANNDPAFELADCLTTVNYSFPGNFAQLEFQALPDSHLKIAKAAEKLYPGAGSFFNLGIYLTPPPTTGCV